MLGAAGCWVSISLHWWRSEAAWHLGDCCRLLRFQGAPSPREKCLCGHSQHNPWHWLEPETWVLLCALPPALQGQPCQHRAGPQFPYLQNPHFCLKNTFLLHAALGFRLLVGSVTPPQGSRVQARRGHCTPEAVTNAVRSVGPGRSSLTLRSLPTAPRLCTCFLFYFSP